MSNFKGEVRFSILPEWILDASVSDRAIRVYALLARYADSETLEAFPSRQTLAKRAGCHTKSVDRAIEELEKLGALVKTHRRNGDAYASNLYILRRVATPESLGRDTGVPRVGTPESPGRDTGVHLTITKELEPKEEEPINEMFDRFWEIYPRREKKPDAFRAFKKAVKDADLEVILSGARSYLEDPNREDAFTKLPGTWLRNECWNDPPLPQRKLSWEERKVKEAEENKKRIEEWLRGESSGRKPKDAVSNFNIELKGPEDV